MNSLNILARTAAVAILIVGTLFCMGSETYASSSSVNSKLPYAKEYSSPMHAKGLFPEYERVLEEHLENILQQLYSASGKDIVRGTGDLQDTIKCIMYARLFERARKLLAEFEEKDVCLPVKEQVIYNYLYWFERANYVMHNGVTEKHRSYSQEFENEELYNAIMDSRIVQSKLRLVALSEYNKYRDDEERDESEIYHKIRRHYEHEPHLPILRNINDVLDIDERIAREYSGVNRIIYEYLGAMMYSTFNIFLFQGAMYELYDIAVQSDCPEAIDGIRAQYREGVEDIMEVFASYKDVLERLEKFKSIRRGNRKIMQGFASIMEEIEDVVTQDPLYTGGPL